MKSTAASVASDASGKLPLGSPSGFWKPILIGSPSAASGLAMPHARSDRNRPAPRPSASSIESSIAGHPADPPLSPLVVAVSPPAESDVAALVPGASVPATVVSATALSALDIAVVPSTSASSSSPHAAATNASTQEIAIAPLLVRPFMCFPCLSSPVMASLFEMSSSGWLSRDRV